MSGVVPDPLPTADAPTLTEFLLARIAEDEEDARSGVMPEGSWRMLAECEAKRRIVEDFTTLDADYQVTHSEATEARRFQALVSAAHLAVVYSDHPDYCEEWKP